eukprot:TRINITY_DN272_c1_g1_i5.p1 TRINITY_DN272_c1_g1~~TRINITY_DN272_c1_g1_i5.p1  ORF type:complete len:306 (+),score=15.03 TRINITY_DN272_c1_g1_i5:224-1141(+)
MSSRFDCPITDTNCTVCHIQYTGTQCELNALDMHINMFLVRFNQGFQIISILFCLVWAFYGLYIRIIVEERRLWNMGLSGAFLCIGSLVFRALSLIDYLGVFGNYDPAVLYLTLGGFYILAYASCTLGIAIWIGIVIALKKLKKGNFMEVPKRIFIIICCIQITFYIVISIFGWITSDWRNASNIFNICGFITLVVSLGCVFYFGPLIMEITGNGGNSTKLVRLQRYVMFYIYLFVSISLLAICLTVFKLMYHPNHTYYLFVLLIFQTGMSFLGTLSNVVALLFVFDWFPYTKTFTQTKNREQTK